MAYKDEYEVARLHLRLDLDEVAAELGFGAGYRARYMLHPPTLRRLGLDRKIGLGRSGRVAFRGLAALRRVRGTPLDLFGYARHRREERQVADEYAQLMTTALAGLTPDTYSAALDLARSVATIRGYEDIKSAAIARWRTETADLRAEVGAAT
jgi:indolepyruvate ferredoxin oxidoreductase